VTVGFGRPVEGAVGPPRRVRDVADLRGSSSGEALIKARGRERTLLDSQPLSSNPSEALRLVTAGVRATAVEGEPLEEALASLAPLVTGEGGHGRLFVRDRRAVGIAVWEPPGPVGVFVLLLYFEPSAAAADSYRTALLEIERSGGPVAFVLRRLDGLSEPEESVLMRALGFERYGRSEMRFPPSREPPAFPPPPGVALRAPRSDDSAAFSDLNTRAYAGSLDRYLFLTDLDPQRDSERVVREVLAGRYGEFLASASFVAEEGLRMVGACLVVRASYGPLIVNVMVDPAAQGRGIAKALLSASLRALRARGETVAALNVTEGNRSAVRAYERIGFVRSIGPQWSWYSRTRIPGAPGRA